MIGSVIATDVSALRSCNDKPLSPRAAPMADRDGPVHIVRAEIPALEGVPKPLILFLVLLVVLWLPIAIVPRPGERERLRQRADKAIALLPGREPPCVVHFAKLEQSVVWPRAAIADVDEETAVVRWQLDVVGLLELTDRSFAQRRI